jgi:hypothetical protein
MKMNLESGMNQINTSMNRIAKATGHAIVGFLVHKNSACQTFNKGMLRSFNTYEVDHTRHPLLRYGCS